MRIFIVAVLLAIGAKRDQRAAQQLQQAKAAYEQALTKTGDFDCAAPEFDAVLKMLDGVPAATPSKAEAKDLAKRIREKRAAASQHAKAIDAARSTVPQVMAQDAPPPSQAAPEVDCKSAKRRMLALAVARKKAGKPPLGQMAFADNGEVAYVPGAEPSVEEAALQESLKRCP